jgi:hypothetical protein
MQARAQREAKSVLPLHTADSTAILRLGTSNNGKRAHKERRARARCSAFGRRVLKDESTASAANNKSQTARGMVGDLPDEQGTHIIELNEALRRCTFIVGLCVNSWNESTAIVPFR